MFDETGSVEDALRNGRPSAVTTEENMQRVFETFLLNPRTFQKCKLNFVEVINNI
jgi:hypothetical protein